MPRRCITGWHLDARDRTDLLARLPPAYPRVVADHVTLRFGTDDATPLPTATGGAVIGVADDGSGVEALVVAIGGTTQRGDGSHFHLTWSLAAGRGARESNDVIARSGWIMLDQPVPVRLEPARWWWDG